MDGGRVGEVGGGAALGIAIEYRRDGVYRYRHGCRADVEIEYRLIEYRADVDRLAYIVCGVYR